MQVLAGAGAVLEVVEVAQLLFEQEGAVETAVGVLNLGERRELAFALAFGGFQQAPAQVFDPAPPLG